MEAIKFLILDVDGTLTDGGIYLSDEVSNLKNSTQKMVWGLERLFLRGLKWASLVTVIHVK